MLNSEKLILDSTEQTLLYVMYIYAHSKNNTMNIVFILH